MFKKIVKLVGLAAAYVGIYVVALLGFSVIGNKMTDIVVEMQANK